ncbi:MAG: acyl carrier protein [Acidimicrobiia bacterium]|nr:acyl carrier protein [Acidimicrobiia bacterium]
MDRSEAFEVVSKLAIEVCAADPAAVTEAARFTDDLDADSLDLMELVMAIEEHFGIEVPEDEIEGVVTVGDAVDLVLAKVDASA